jgi:hypothetical protein
MPKVIPQRMTARIEGDFVLFLIGMRINKLWKIHKWLPTLVTMPKMIRELEGHPESGFLGFKFAGPMTLIQYWRSFEHLEAYARSHDHEHWPAWLAFNKRMGASRGDVGIWHETYQIRAGQYEAIYSGMPPTGLGQFAELKPASGAHDSARGRISQPTA